MFDSVLNAIYDMTRKSPTSYSTLETSMGHRTLVHTDSSLVSIIRFHGIAKLVGTPETEIIVEDMSKMLNPYFRRSAFDVHFAITRDDMTPQTMLKHMQPSLDTARRLGFEESMDEIFHEQANTLARYTMDDTILIALFTRANALSKQDMKEWSKEMVQQRRDGLVHVPPNTQDETYAIDPLSAIHEAYVDDVVNTLKDSRIGGQLEVLDVDQATAAIGHMLDPQGISKDWKPWLLPTCDSHLAMRVKGEPLVIDAPPRVRSINKRYTKVANSSIFFPPPLRDQVITQEPVYPSSGYLEYGGRLYATVSMVIPPKRNTTKGANLIYALTNVASREKVDGKSTPVRVPYRVSMRMRAAGLTQGKFRAMFAPIVAAGSPNNFKLMRAFTALRTESEQDESMGTLSVSITTWVSSSLPDAADRLRSRVVAIRSAASQWGDMIVTEDTIDRWQALTASIPGLTQHPCSNEATGNIEELLPLFPWARPASALGNDGTEIYRSQDGALLKTASHSSKQDYWLMTMTAPMGGGKSVQANRLHLDYIFAPGRQTLPFLHILDIGGSVSGLVEMLQDNLPDDKKYLVYSHVMRNRREDAVNMLDTKPGLRYPLEGDLQATVEWLTALVTPAERDKPYDNMAEFCRAILIALYKRKDDALESASPGLYKVGDSHIVDQALEDLRIDSVIHNETPWFEVADRLIEHHSIEAAIAAHCFAMPLLSELSNIAQDENVRGDFMNALTDQGQPIPDAFVVQLALARESYPIFTDFTRLSLRGRRVTAIDLQEAAPKGNASARKQSSLMYQTAYELFSRNIRIVEEDIKQIPRAWLPYYNALIEELKNTDKHVSVDEYHRTMIKELSEKDAEDHDTTGIRATLVREGGRESRKWGMSLLTISQLTHDHGKLFSLASGNFIMKGGASTTEANYQKETMAMSSTDATAMKLFVNGPTKGGATFFARWTTKAGSFNQLFTSTIGPKTLWSLSSTHEDKTVRQIVFQHLGRKNGRAVLARHYPGGTAKDEVERRKLLTSASSQDDDATTGACMLVAQELITAYRTNPHNYD